MTKTAAAKKMDQKAISWLEKYLRYTDFIGAAQLYLKSNCLTRQSIKYGDLKERILGHWGTVPGLNFLYAHLNYLITKHQHDKNPNEFMFLVGPGHGAPGVIASLFAENSMAEYYPELKQNEKGLSKLIKMFSWPGGFPSHVNPMTPGAILEGGELGYSLATSFGAVLDNPDLIVACVCGDGESETGPLATAWHGNKFLNPKTSGAVLPIVHANGYKITSPTIYATMSDEELTHLFTGLGYEPRIIHDTDPTKMAHQEMIDTLEWAYTKIREIQQKARSTEGQKNPPLKPKWPMIVYRSIKGRTGIKHADGHKVEGTYHSHGIPIGDPRTNPEHFKLVKNWLESYKFAELVNKKGEPLPEVLEFVPKKNPKSKTDFRMGMCKYAIGGNMRKKLIFPKLDEQAVKVTKKNFGKPIAGNTAVGSNFIRDIFRKNPNNFRFFCPDETESNKFQSLFEATKRAFMWPVHSYDENLSPDGRVMEVLSEHNLQGWMQGFILTGRHGMFATYEAFAGIIATMVDQYAKFLKQSSRVPWRKPLSSMNYLLTSVGWRQEHNGYSHQNPGFISGLLEKHGSISSVYFPCDANSLLVTLEDCFSRTNCINAIVSNKNPMPQWLTLEEAREENKVGLGIWEFIDPVQAKNPDLVLSAAGDVMVQETIAAIEEIRKLAPEIRIRFVNVNELTALGIGDEKHSLDDEHQRKFEKFFTKNKPIIFNFHGYPATIKKLIFGHAAANRFSIHGYLEEGTTTTPFNMMVLNKTDRWNLAIDAIEKAAALAPEHPHLESLAKRAPNLIRKLHAKIAAHQKYILENGKDLPEIENWKCPDSICKRD